MEMKLYCFRVGGIRFPELPEDLPIYAYLIEHPKGRVLVDTGESYALRDANAVMEEGETILLRTDVPEAEMFWTTMHLMMAVITRYAVGLAFKGPADPEEELRLQKNMLLQEFSNR